MKYFNSISRRLLLAWLTIIGSLAFGQDGTSYPLVQTSVEPTSGTIGDRISLLIEATAPDVSGLDVIIPDSEPTTWTIPTREPMVSDSAGANGNQVRRYSYTIIPFATGRLTIPRVAVTYATAGQSSNTVLSEPLWIEISSVLGAKDDALREAHGPDALPLPRAVIWSGLILFLCILAALGLWLWRRYAARLKKMLGGALRPDELALREFGRLESENLIEQKKVKEFYTRLADVLRNYISEAYGVHATDLTSTELLRELDEQADGVPHHHAQDFRKAMARLTELLDEADLVKFARMLPEASQCRKALAGSRDVVKFTNYRFLPAEEVAPVAGGPAASTPGSNR